MCKHVRGWVGPSFLVLFFWCIQSRLLGGEIESQAEKTLRALTGYASGLKSFRTEITASYKVQSSAANSKATFVYSIAGAAPNRLATVVRSGDGAPVVISDGKLLFTYAPASEKYVRGDAPSSFAAIVADKAVRGTSFAHSLFAGVLLPFNDYDTLATTIDEAQHLGEEKIAGVKCHHLRVVQKQYAWDLWVDAGKKPTLRKLEPDLTKWLESNPTAAPADSKVEAQFLVKAFLPDVAVKDKDFKIDPPAAAREVASLDPEPGEREPRPAELLKGKPAPLFQAAVLGGGVANLSAHKGREVVILDFWATWCPPCVASLPSIAEVAASYKSRGVAFYAVNCKEDPPEIVDFLKSKQLNIPVALDPDGAVGRLYRVTGIPQTVIIDKDGVVQIVHIGAPADVKKQLSAELDGVLSKKSAGK